jgi:hypothetical protein
MENEPEQDALFEIEGPAEDGCVWICSAKERPAPFSYSKSYTGRLDRHLLFAY